MRILLLLLLAGVGAYFTVPAQSAHEAAARAYLEGGTPGEPAANGGGITLESVVAHAKGMLAGQGRYENYYLVSKYTVDMPGAAYLECYGAFTLVKCQEAGATP